MAGRPQRKLAPADHLLSRRAQLLWQCVVAALKGLSKALGQIVRVKPNFDHDDSAVCLGLKPHQRATIAVKPLAHGSEHFGKSGAVRAHLDGSHSEPPRNVRNPWKSTVWQHSAALTKVETDEDFHRV